jgi:hypothetical protein
MTQFFTPAAAIIDRMATNLASITPAIEMVIDNEDYTDIPGVSFFVIAVDFNSAVQASISGGLNKRFRTSGTINIEIFTPIGQGVKLGLDYADQISSIFRATKFSSVLVFTPTILGGQQRKYQVGEWWSTPMIIPFQSDEFFTI